MDISQVFCNTLSFKPDENHPLKRRGDHCVTMGDLGDLCFRTSELPPAVPLYH